MQKIVNYTLKEFERLQEPILSEYITLLRYVRKVDIATPLHRLKLREVEDIKSMVLSGDFAAYIEIIAKVEGLAPEKVRNLKILEFFGKLHTVTDQLERLADAEAAISEIGEFNPKWQAVNGGEIMGKFGILNTLEFLSGGDILKYDAILDLEYSFVLSVLKMKYTANSLNSKMAKIKSK